jgi:hypothetical protein
LLLLGSANAPSLLDSLLPHTAVNRMRYFCPAQYHMPWWYLITPFSCPVIRLNRLAKYDVS